MAAMATPAPAVPRVRVVEIPFCKLVDPDADLTQELWQGFGPDGLGIVTVSGCPDFERLREQLLPLAAAFAELPPEARAACEHAPSSYNVGWSHGKEALRSGARDSHKGSFYANPLQDSYPSVPAELAARYPAYYSDNVWPSQQLPALEPALKALGRLIIDVGLRLAGHCSRYVAQQVANAKGGPLTRAELAALDFGAQLAASDCHKARLLHYFPVAQQQAQQAQQQASDEDWCGWHLDHGALTGLTSAMYMRGGEVVPNPDPSAGLYICDRSGEVVQAAIPPGHIAYQLGQVLSIQSGGLLRATPHYVRAAAAGPPDVSRNTFAVFLQPALTTTLAPPAGVEALGSLLCLDAGHWAPGMSFGEFAELTLSGYYQHSSAAQAQAQHTGLGGSPAASPAKDVAPAAVHVAAQAAGRQRLQLLVSHE